MLRRLSFTQDAVVRDFKEKYDIDLSVDELKDLINAHFYQLSQVIENGNADTIYLSGLGTFYPMYRAALKYANALASRRYAIDEGKYIRTMSMIKKIRKKWKDPNWAEEIKTTRFRQY